MKEREIKFCKSTECPTSQSGNYGTKACEGCKIWGEVQLKEAELAGDEAVKRLKKMVGIKD